MRHRPAAAVQGVIDVFNFHGQLEYRLVTGGVLESPGAAGWTMALDKLAAYVATHGD
jgi:hypothetical protein